MTALWLHSSHFEGNARADAVTGEHRSCNIHLVEEPPETEGEVKKGVEGFDTLGDLPILGGGLR